jgi:TorA maturation chaperone TorD
MGANSRFALVEDAFRCFDFRFRRETAGPIDRLRAARPDREALLADYRRLFGRAARSPVRLRETEYGQGNQFQQARRLADVARCYVAFGLTPPSAAHVPADHMASECEFMGCLALKEAHLMTVPERTAIVMETLRIVRRAQRTFLRDHLGGFGQAVGLRLASESEAAYFSAWGAFFLVFLARECARASVTTERPDLARTAGVVDIPMPFETAKERMQTQRRCV